MKSSYLENLFCKGKRSFFQTPNFMMKKYFFFFICCFFSAVAFAQTQADLTVFNTERLRINHTGMYILGGWAVANLGVNGVLLFRAEGERKFFYQMNVFWNVVNGGLALSGLLSHDDPAGFSAFQSLKEHLGMEKILLLNAGLDVGYIATGLWLWEKGKTPGDRAEMFTGYGQSLVLQGAFLLLFDGIMYGTLHHHLNQNEGLFKNLKLSGNGIGLIFRL
jgi:hypothetical protein